MRITTRLQLQFARVDYDGRESVAVVRMLIRPRDHDWFYFDSYCRQSYTPLLCRLAAARMGSAWAKRVDRSVP
jgi:hypothetical protein